MDNKLKQVTEKLIISVKDLVEQSQEKSSDFSDILLGILRNSLMTLRDMRYLSSYDETGSSILDLARKLIENVVSVEYILMKDKEKMSKRFKDYLWVQLHQEISFMQEIGQDPKAISTEVKFGAEQVEQEYSKLAADIKKDRSWAGRSIEDMIKDIHAAGKMGEFDFSRLSISYIQGCRLNHLNPYAIGSYLEKDSSVAASTYDLRLGLFMGCTSLIRLVHRYIDELRQINGKNVHEDVAQKLTSLLQEFDSLAGDKT